MSPLRRSPLAAPRPRVLRSHSRGGRRRSGRGPGGRRPGWAARSTCRRVAPSTRPLLDPPPWRPPAGRSPGVRSSPAPLGGRDAPLPPQTRPVCAQPARIRAENVVHRKLSTGRGSPQTVIHRLMPTLARVREPGEVCGRTSPSLPGAAVSSRFPGPGKGCCPAHTCGDGRSRQRTMASFLWTTLCTAFLPGFAGNAQGVEKKFSPSRGELSTGEGSNLWTTLWITCGQLRRGCG